MIHDLNSSFGTHGGNSGIVSSSSRSSSPDVDGIDFPLKEFVVDSTAKGVELEVEVRDAVECFKELRRALAQRNEEEEEVG